METRRITVLSAGLGVPSSSRLLADQLAAGLGVERADLRRGVRAVLGVQGDEPRHVTCVERVEPGLGDRLVGVRHARRCTAQRIDAQHATHLP